MDEQGKDIVCCSRSEKKHSCELTYQKYQDLEVNFQTLA